MFILEKMFIFERSYLSYVFQERTNYNNGDTNNKIK